MVLEEKVSIFTLGDKIREVRQERGWSREELADLVNKSTNVISEWESDKNKPDIDELVKLCEALHCPLSQFVQVINADTANTEIEKSLLVRFRALDNAGKDVVTNAIDQQYERRKASC